MQVPPGKFPLKRREFQLILKSTPFHNMNTSARRNAVASASTGHLLDGCGELQTDAVKLINLCLK